MASIREKLADKLMNELGYYVYPSDIISYRRNGYGARIMSWGTLDGKVSCFETMAQCVKHETRYYKDNGTIIMTILPIPSPHVEIEKRQVSE
jgi:hypothetical protein